MSESYLDKRSVWKAAKPLIRKQDTFQDDHGVLIVDDSIAEKPYTDENALICWHYDHTNGQMVKGVNFITMLYAYKDDLSVPLQVEFVEKTEPYLDPKSGKTKNEMVRQMLGHAPCLVNFQYVLGDS